MEINKRNIKGARFDNTSKNSMTLKELENYRCVMLGKNEKRERLSYSFPNERQKSS